VAQTESLCGGAAAAMVMRFWGAHHVYAESFADLVDPAAGGIHGKDLVEALGARGWQAVAFAGDETTVRSHLGKGRPIVALIEDRPGTYHYVVIVAWMDDRVILHDPARAPFRVVDTRRFLSSWAASGRWSMIVLPSAGASSEVQPAIAAAPVPRSETPLISSCSPAVAHGVELANAGAMDDAARVLEEATKRCPDAPDAWRELAGLHAVEREWKAAADDARRALARDAGDQHAARILATSLFLEDEPDQALAIWNTLGEPAIDLVNVTGLARTRHEVVANAIGLQHGQLLTVAELARARRRLAEVPSVMTSRISFTPGDDVHAQVEAAVVERPLMPTGAALLAVAGARALTDRELSWSVASPSGGGELFSVAWRWWENRPRLGFRFNAPSPSHRLGGVWTIDAFAERQTYGGAETLIEDRRGVTLKAADWITGGFRWEASLGFDDWRTRGRSVSVSGAVEQHLAADRLVVGLRGSVFTQDVDARTAGARVRWRSSARPQGQVWIAESGIDVVTRSSPLALWSGAGTGQGRDALLRAHPLLDDGIIDGGVFGRRLTHANVEWRYWKLWPGKPVRIGPAVFVDAARAHQRALGLPDRSEVDAGAGLRIGVPGGNVLRIDLARGLRDGATAFSIGWTR